MPKDKDQTGAGGTDQSLLDAEKVDSTSSGTGDKEAEPNAESPTIEETTDEPTT